MAINVRLSDEETRMAAKLRAAGVQISALVRQAIRSEYERRIERPGRDRGSDVVHRILADLPDPPDLEPRTVPAGDRRAVQQHIRERLRKGRR